jgi:hypothetical protein
MQYLTVFGSMPQPEYVFGFGTKWAFKQAW